MAHIKRTPTEMKVNIARRNVFIRCVVHSATLLRYVPEEEYDS